MSETTTAPKAALHVSNIIGSPGSTWAGAAAILAVVAGAMKVGFPTSSAGWIAFAAAVLTGIGAAFSKA